MRVLRNPHAPYRELLAARLDRPLTRVEVRKLATHLKACPTCQQVDQDYRQQRLLLRGLSNPIPPRDMWARTSTALDREMARWQFRLPWGRRAARRRARSAAPGALTTVVAALTVVTALTVLQLAPAIQSDPSASPGRPTPFAVAPQDLAFVGTSAADLAIYSTRVSQVCPTNAPDCFFDEKIVRRQLNLGTSVKPRNVALSPTGNRLAVVGHDVNDDVIAVVQLPPDAGSGASDPRSDPPAGAGNPTDAATPNQPPGSEPSGTATDPSDNPLASASTSGNETPDPAATPGLATAPPATAVAGLTVLSILEDVHSAGAAPAWSPDGAVLAFSAMPSDGSHGPDVYVWQSGEARARPITTDHASFFASWAEGRVVASRALGTAEEGASAELETVVIDPQTLEERVVAGPSMWLPAVNPQGTHGVVWYGSLVWQTGQPVPREGALYTLDWSAIDPFAEGAPAPAETPAAEETPDQTPVKGENPATTEPTEQPGPTDRSEVTPAPDSTAAPDETASPEATAEPDATSAPEATNEPGTSGAPGSTDDAGISGGSRADSTNPPDAEATDGSKLLPTPAVPDLLQPINATATAFTEWRVQWSADGVVLGIWVADASGSPWGQLVVTSLDPATGRLTTDDALFGPMFASQSFTLGLDRVAWVAPTDESPEGELRIQTWGIDGVGELNLKPFDGEELVPAF